MYKKITILINTDELAGILTAFLSEAGYEGFEETERQLYAYIPENLFDEKIIHNLSVQYDVEYAIENIADTNWNAVWEAGFEPVRIHNFCGIRASFHPPMQGVKHEIIITPKMSFGTGHHATTFLMIEQMSRINFAGKKVLDFGTGTGILAILGAQLGARVTAIDNDIWAINNAYENIRDNKMQKDIQLMQQAIIPDEKFDIILANINRNIIEENFNKMQAALFSQGILLLSGLLKEDEIRIKKAGENLSLIFISTIEKDNWISMQFQL